MPQCNGMAHTVSFLLTAVVTCRLRKLATVSPQVRLDTEAIMEHGCKLKETTGVQAELGMMVRKGKRTGLQKPNSVYQVAVVGGAVRGLLLSLEVDSALTYCSSKLRAPVQSHHIVVTTTLACVAADASITSRTRRHGDDGTCPPGHE